MNAQAGARPLSGAVRRAPAPPRASLPAVGLLLAGLLAGGLISGCGSHVSRRELRLERAQFVQVAGELREVESAVHGEVRTARAAYPSLAAGIPSRVGPSLSAAVDRASATAGALPAPPFLAKTRQLTGPASGIAGLYEDYERLAERGWRLTETTVSGIASGGPRVASFVRANSSLYIDCIYDAHFDLSSIAKHLTDGYAKLGGPAGFGPALTPSQLEALAAAYSIPAVRLQPHPARSLEEH